MAKIDYYKKIDNLLKTIPHELQVEFALYCAKDARQFANKKDLVVIDAAINLTQRWLNRQGVTNQELNAAANAANAAANAANAAAYAAAHAAYAAANAAAYVAANATAHAANAAAYAAAHAAYAAAHAAANAAANAAAKDKKYKQHYDYLVSLLNNLSNLERIVYGLIS